jgi:penicillin-binding protein 1A
VDEALAAPTPTPGRKYAPHFINHIKQQLESIVGADRVYKGGLTVFTTLSHRLQQAAEETMDRRLEQLEERRIANGIPSPFPQGALIAIDVSTGGLVAMIGGYGEKKGDFNRATMAKRQPGSSFKPIIYALAVERGYDQHQKLLDAPVVFQASSRSQEWQPENFSNRYDGEITMRWALAHSKNIPVVRLIEQLGPSSIVQFGQTLGIQSNIAPNLSLALGTSEVSLLELTAAYATFANQGRSIDPYGITSVVDDNGQTIWKIKPKQRIAMSRSGAAIVTNMLEAVIQAGTGRRAGILPGPVAGKTGTTNDYKDALFIGYAPSIAVGVWVGIDDATTLGPRETGAKAALPVWIDFMQVALKGQPQRYFDIPDDVRQVHIHPKTGEILAASHREALPILIKRRNGN